MQSCSIPNEWKIHKIVLIPNSSDLSKVQNYRPISLLCILSKTLELIIYNKIIDFIRPLISKRQFGFLKIALVCLNCFPLFLSLQIPLNLGSHVTLCFSTLGRLLIPFPSRNCFLSCGPTVSLDLCGNGESKCIISFMYPNVPTRTYTFCTTKELLISFCV